MGSWIYGLVMGQIALSPECKALHALPAETEPGYDGASNLIHPDDRDRVLDELTAILGSDSEYFNCEHRAIAGDGQTLP
jgi:hypothetical protein